MGMGSSSKELDVPAKHLIETFHWLRIMSLQVLHVLLILTAGSWPYCDSLRWLR